MSSNRQRPGPGRPFRGFHPPHCPNRRCRFYRPAADWPYRREGFYRAPHLRRPAQRYRCLHCGRKFSTRTFSTTYWLHHRSRYARIARLSVAGAGIRQIARTLGLSPSTVVRHLARAGRHCLLFHRQMVADSRIEEPIAFDGFESFEYSQFFPFHINLAAGRCSWFLYHFTDSPLRRKGRMTQAQRRRRAELERRLGRPPRRAIENAIVELLQVLTRQVDPSLPVRLLSDDHPAYRRAMRRVRTLRRRLRLKHQTTPSTDPRTRANPLFPVNLADLLLRHTGANHRRETIAFSKRRQGAIERMAIFTVWRNAIKWRREKKPGRTAAMTAGLIDRPLSWPALFRRRLFPRRRWLPASWWRYYWRRVPTPAIGPPRPLRCRYAF